MPDASPGAAKVGFLLAALACFACAGIQRGPVAPGPVGEDVRFVTANQLRVGYLSAGEGPLVLLLHGFPDNAYSFEAVLPELAAAGYQAVSVFLRGYSPTDVP